VGEIVKYYLQKMKAFKLVYWFWSNGKLL